MDYQYQNKSHPKIKNIQDQNAALLKENQTLRQFINKLQQQKPNVHNTQIDMDSQVNILLELLQLQRQRVQSLENELDLTLDKYEILLYESTNKAGDLSSKTKMDVAQLEARVQKLEMRNEILEAKLSESAQSYGKQVAQLKAKLTEQNAEILMNQDGLSKGPMFTPTMHKSGAFKKEKAAIKNLHPIQDMNYPRQQNPMKEQLVLLKDVHHSSEVRQDAYQDSQGYDQRNPNSIKDKLHLLKKNHYTNRYTDKYNY